MSGYNFEIRGIDNFLKDINNIRSNFQRDLENLIKKYGVYLFANTKKLTPVDTGRLRMSITSDTSNINNFEASVGTNVEYATHVEYGTRKQSPKPYLRPAYNKNVAKLQTKINKVLGGK